MALVRFVRSQAKVVGRNGDHLFRGRMAFSSIGEFPGGQTVPFESELKIIEPQMDQRIPAFRVMNEDGSLRAGAQHPQIDEETMQKMYQTMVRLQCMDQIFYDAQRQGRISFYMTSNGEEAAQIGSAAAVSRHDTMFAQYREPGALMWRGFTLENFADQCYGNCDDFGKGRQMPVHYGSASLNYHTISSPLATQIPQAAGAAYALKIAGKKSIVVCYFGEGAASEGDFHAALNFASTLSVPTLFFCRNNGFAISTSVTEQFRGDGIASRAIGYGMAHVRVDGNDIWAVYEATKRAREYILKEGKPVLIEAMTYRQGHHSTSDDSTRYRDVSEIKKWRDEHDPVARMRRYMEAKNIWDEHREKSLRETEMQAVLSALVKSEAKDRPELKTLFEDVYAEKPKHLQLQEEAMQKHIAKYPQNYALDGGH